MKKTLLELAGYIDAAGGLGKPIPPGKIPIPGRTWIEDDSLKWELWPGDKVVACRLQEPREELLNEFVRLWDSPDSAILNFAKQNGVLAEEEGSIKGIEPLERWRHLSRVALAMLNIGAALSRKEKRVDQEELRFLIGEDLAENAGPPAVAGIVLSHVVDHWVGGVGFSLAGDWRQFHLEINYHRRMIHAVALQLALTVSRAKDLFFCSGCGYPYSRPADQRRPKPGQANFCAKCGTPAALRHANARRRAKVADAQRLAEEGVSLREIAGQLDTTTASVRRWIKKGK